MIQEYEVYEILHKYDWNETIATDQLRVMSEWSEQGKTQNWGANLAAKRDDKPERDSGSL